MNLNPVIRVFVLGLMLSARASYVGQALIATGALDASGTDLSTKTAKLLENGVAGKSIWWNWLGFGARRCG